MKTFNSDRKKEKELLKNGWMIYHGAFSRYSRRLYVKKEWMLEDEYGKHWYETHTLYNAYNILEGEKLREKYKYETKLKYW